MTALNPRLWRQAAKQLQLSDIKDPAVLGRDERRVLAADLMDTGWSYREVSAALDIPTTTLHRWLAEDTDVSSSAEPARVVPWIVAVAVGAALIAIFRKGKPV